MDYRHLFIILYDREIIEVKELHKVFETNKLPMLIVFISLRELCELRSHHTIAHVKFVRRLITQYQPKERILNINLVSNTTSRTFNINRMGSSIVNRIPILNIKASNWNNSLFRFFIFDIISITPTKLNRQSNDSVTGY